MADTAEHAPRSNASRALAAFADRNRKEERRVVVVIGAGQWAMKYANSLKWYVRNKDLAACVFFYHEFKRFAIADEPEAENAELNRYLSLALDNVREIDNMDPDHGFCCVDRDDLSTPEFEALRPLLSPTAVFVVTPASLHCSTAQEWLGFSERVFIEKPFDVSPQKVDELKDKVDALSSGNQLRTAVYGYDHYAARCVEFLRGFQAADKLGVLGQLHILGKSGFSPAGLRHIEFRMLEAIPHGLTERRPAIEKEGMIFDMASHCLACVLPLCPDLSQLATQTKSVRVSTLELPDGLPKIQTETFAVIKTGFRTDNPAFGADNVNLEVVVGKGIGKVDEKWIDLVDRDGNKLRVDMIHWSLRNVSRKGESTILAMVRESVIDHLVTSLITNPKSSQVPLVDALPGIVTTEQGRKIVEVLCSWHKGVVEALKHASERNQTHTYHVGASLDNVKKNRAIEVRTDRTAPVASSP